MKQAADPSPRPFPTLKPKEQRGSKPRCHLLTHGSVDDVARRLSTLMAPFGSVAATDHWMPRGFDHAEEAQLHTASLLLDSEIAARLGTWWLAPASKRAKTPNFDIASTCTIEGTTGLLLIEAKAHSKELENEAAGRRLEANSSEDRKASHETIGAAIEAARKGPEQATLLPWQIGRDTHYQMSNRFAWCWKLTQFGVPVVLIYLGFLNADEMDNQGAPFVRKEDWEREVLLHSKPLFPEGVWNRRWTLHGLPFIPLIRTTVQPLTY